jgi:hypothetical protein
MDSDMMLLDDMMNGDDLKRISHLNSASTADGDERTTYISSKDDSPSTIQEQQAVINDNFQMLSSANFAPNNQNEAFTLHSPLLKSYQKCNATDEQEDNCFLIRKPVEQIIASKGKGEFRFDPENGGGRRRRIKAVSRFEIIRRTDLIE